MAIADNLNRIIQAKADIKSAIEDKGVSVGDITIDGYAAKIAEIEGGGVSDTTLEKNAIILDITSNGTYYTKYADLPEPVYTGDDGFTGYASMSKSGGGTGSLNTNYVGDEYSVVELWFRHFGNNSGDNAIVQRFYYGGSYRLMVNGLRGIFEVGTARYEITLPTDEFLHIKFSNNGFWINDELVLDNLPLYTASKTNKWEIGGAGNCGIGDYGMVKIDDNVYIPTENGFINQSTGEALPNATNSPFVFTYNEFVPPFTYNFLIKQVNVNTKVNVHEYQIKLAYYPNSTIPEWLDFSNISNEDLKDFFRNSNIQISNGLENIDTSNLTSLINTFYYCMPLLDVTPIYNWNVSNVTDMSSLFANCTNLTNIDLSQWDTSNVTTMDNMLQYCTNLTHFGTINCSKVNRNCYPVKNYSDLTNLTELGGFIGMKSSWDNNYGLTKCPNLTYESCINVLNGLYDFVGNSETPNSNQGVLKVHANFLTTVGDEISIATNKGWQVIS